jgi:DAK2 domain fusion protein YloV
MRWILPPLRFRRMSHATEFGVEELRLVVATFRTGLSEHREAINRLNVYPVPDGDTGTNMGLTVESVLAELADADSSMAATCAAISHGSLMGARGNSGVILSQILRGMAASFEPYDVVGAAIVVAALESASSLAYEAVMKPVEGTILTVVRYAAEAARSSFDAGNVTLIEAIEAAHVGGYIALEKTPDLLPVLKEAGVVDAGGAGFLLLLDAMLHVLAGRAMPVAPDDVAAPTVAGFERPDAHDGDVSDLRYEVMYFLEAPDESIPGFKNVWAGIGDSIVVVGGDGVWNCHVHTNDIGAAIEAAVDVGRPRQIRVTDLAEEVEEERWVREAAAQLAAAPEPKREQVGCAVVAVSPAEGIGRIFHSLGVQELVAGGQTMNPSTADLVAAVEHAPAESVVILPNNKNIIAVALQVAANTNKTVEVVATRSVPEGFASLLGYDPEATASENVATMTDVAEDVVVGEVTQAVRQSSSDAGPIEAGDWLGIDSEGIRVVRSSLDEAAIRLLDLIVSDSHEIITVIEGSGATTADTRTLTGWVTEHRPGAEIEVHNGGQPHYPYFFGVE